MQFLGKVKDILLEDCHLNSRFECVAARREHCRLGEVDGGDGETGLREGDRVPATATADEADAPRLQFSRDTLEDRCRSAQVPLILTGLVARLPEIRRVDGVVHGGAEPSFKKVPATL